MAKKYRYDVFLSHSSKNKPEVLALAERLKASGLRVWFDSWEIQPGDPIFQKLQEGLQKSRVLLLFLSRQATRSDWASLESQSILFRDPLNKDRRFIPIRLDDAKSPEILRHFAYVDWRAPSDAAYASLLESVRPLLSHAAPPRSARPAPCLGTYSAGIKALSMPS